MTGYHALVTASIPRLAAGWAVTFATALAIIGVAVVLFLNPIYVGLEQNRVGAAARTGYSPDELRHVSGAVLSDLVFGPPAFDVTARGERVFSERERGHMVDVRGVFFGFGVAVVVALGILVAGRLLSGGAPWFWQATRRGAVGLAWGVVVVGVGGALAFDLAFEIFHRIFFAGGTYLFDPTSDRLIQLFPQEFWFETSIALGIVILAIAMGLASVSRRRAAPAPQLAPAPQPGASR